MIKRLIIIFSLASFLLGVSSVKPILAAGCSCKTMRYSAVIDCKMIPAPVSLNYEYCEKDGLGKCKSDQCTLVKNSLGHNVNDTCEYDKDPTNGKPILKEDKMFCNDKPPIETKALPRNPYPVDLIISWGCRCMNSVELAASESAKFNKEIIEKGMKDQNPFCDNFGPKTSNPKIKTAIGCLSVNFIDLVRWIFEKGFGIVGGIAFILLIGAFIQLATSEGDTKKIQGAKEMITSTVTGLLLAIFSIFIIRLLMVTILRIPGLQ